MEHQRPFAHILLMVLVCILPLFILMILMLHGYTVSPYLFFALFILGCMAMFFFMRGSPLKVNRLEEEEIPKDEISENLTLAHRVKDVFKLRSQYRVGKNLVIEGELITDADSAYAYIKSQFEKSDITPLLQEDDSGKTILVLVPGALQSGAKVLSKPWINILLLLITIVTTTWAGAAHQGVSLLEQPGSFTVGLPYALGLMFILGAHELGHFFIARAHGMKVSLPYFIPVPFALGTFGAFIQLKSPTENRRTLFDVGIAGPLAGLIFAVPALLIGLNYSNIVTNLETVDLMSGGVEVGSSFIFAYLSKLVLGDALAEGHQLILHPLAFAGWLGLLVTALNLLPIGQLDGGHIAHALFGRKNGHTIGIVALFSLFFLGLFVWSGLLTWAIIIFFIAGTKSAPPLNDVLPLDRKRVMLGAIAFILLFLILIPVPHGFYQSMGIHCPYI